MQPSKSPFPCYWWGISLDGAGLGDLRPHVWSYGRYNFDQLPPVPFEMRGDFAWLATSRAYDHSIANEKTVENARSLEVLKDSSTRLGVQLPEAFRKFMEMPALQVRIRSNTDCFLDLCPELVASPIGDGYLVRFLADSQGCVFWYIYLTPDSDHAVVSSPDFYGTEAEQWEEEPPNPDEIVYCAESFEAFMWRFWLENEIWFAAYEETELPAGGREYVEQYRKTQQ